MFFALGSGRLIGLQTEVGVAGWVRGVTSEPGFERVAALGGSVSISLISFPSI